MSSTDPGVQRAVFEFGVSDAGSATDLAREAADLGYEVEVRRPDDAEGFFNVICARPMSAEQAEITRAREELTALAERIETVEDDADRRRE